MVMVGSGVGMMALWFTVIRKGGNSGGDIDREWGWGVTSARHAAGHPRNAGRLLIVRRTLEREGPRRVKGPKAQSVCRDWRWPGRERPEEAGVN